MNNLKISKFGNVSGIVLVAFFFLCMLWGLFLVDETLKELHLNILRIAYPGFSMSFVGVIVGTIESFIYGWILGGFTAWLCKKICINN